MLIVRVRTAMLVAFPTIALRLTGGMGLAAEHGGTPALRTPANAAQSITLTTSFNITTPALIGSGNVTPAPSPPPTSVIIAAPLLTGSGNVKPAPLPPVHINH